MASRSRRILTAAYVGAGIIGGSSLSITGTPGAATVGTPYSFTPTVAGGSGTKAFTLIGSLPAGLSFNSSTGAISGTPTSAGTTMFGISVTDSSGSASMSGKSITVAAAAPGILMSSRANQMGFNGFNGSDGVDLNSNTRLAFWNETGATVSEASFFFANWFANTTAEQDGYNDMTIWASVVDARNVRTTLATALVIPPNGTASLAELIATGLDIRAGEKYYVDTYVTVGSGQKWPMGYAIIPGNGEAADFATGINKADGSTAITNATATATRRGYGPVAMRANKFSSGTPVKVQIIGFGDSVTEGRTFATVDARGNLGWIGSSCSGRVPYVNLGYSGHAAVNDLANMSRRLNLMSKFPGAYVALGLGSNDLVASRTGEQTLADLISIANALVGVGLKPIAQTIIPRCSGSTDKYDTAAGQTPLATHVGAGSPRGVLNAGIRLKPAPFVDLMEVSDAVEPIRDSGIWIVESDGNSHLLTHVDVTINATSTTTVLNFATSAQLGSNVYAFGGSLDPVSGSQAGTGRKDISANSTTQMTITPAFASAPVVGDVFRAFSVRGRATGDGVHPGSNSAALTFGGVPILMDIGIAKINQLLAAA